MKSGETAVIGFVVIIMVVIAILSVSSIQGAIGLTEPAFTCPVGQVASAENGTGHPTCVQPLTTSRLTSDTAQPLNTATVVQSKTSGCSYNGGTSTICSFGSNTASGNLIVASLSVRGSSTAVQRKNCNFAGSSSTCAFTNNVIKGDVLVVMVGIRQAFTINTPTDSRTTYSLLGSCASNTASVCFFIGTATSSGADTVTITLSGSANTGVTLYELSGVTTSGATSNVGTGTCTANVQYTTSVASTSFVHGDWLLAMYANTAGTVSGVTGTSNFLAFTPGAQVQAEQESASQGDTSPTTFSMTMTSTSNCNWAGVGAVFPTNGAVFSSLTDTQGNTFHLLGSCGVTTNIQSCIYYASPSSAAADTLNLTATLSSAGNIFIFEVSGVTATGASSNSAGTTCGSNPFTYSVPSTTFSGTPFLLSIVAADQSPGTPLTQTTGFTQGTSAQASTVEYAASGISSPTTFPWVSTATVVCNYYAEEGGVFPQSPSTSYVSTGLTFALAANAAYVVNAKVYVTTASSGTINFEVHGLPAGATLVMACGDASSSNNCVTSTGTPVFSSALSAATEYVEFSFTVTTSSTTGTFQLDFSNVAGLGGSVVTVKAGSFLQAQAGV